MILHIPRVLPNSITKNALWQSSFEDEQILQGTCYMPAKQPQLEVLPDEYVTFYGFEMYLKSMATYCNLMMCL